MKVEKLTKLKESTYEATIDGKAYTLDEEMVLKYRLFKGYEISSADLDACLEEHDFVVIKNKAYQYYLRYQKNSYEVLHYLLDREIPYEVANHAVTWLTQNQKLEEDKLAQAIAGALARNSNGPNMIRYKLKSRHFLEESIKKALDSLDEEDISLGKEKLTQKVKKRYKDLPENKLSLKLKEVFYRHGYYEG